MPGEGACYEKAARFFLRASARGAVGLVLVHGTLRYDSGRQVRHAWVEDPGNGRVFDNLDGDGTPVGAPYAFEAWQRRVVAVEAAYVSPRTVAWLARRTNTWGPTLWKRAMAESLLAGPGGTANP